jgi:hypothetical protein
LAPTVGIAVTGFCYPGGIFQLFHREDQQIFSSSTALTSQKISSSMRDLRLYRRQDHYCGLFQLTYWKELARLMMCVTDEKKKQNADFLVDPVASHAGNNKNSVCFYTTRKGKKSSRQKSETFGNQHQGSNVSNQTASSSKESQEQIGITKRKDVKAETPIPTTRSA